MNHWYMLAADGRATLCADKADAEQEARDADTAWPHMGPHRAVQLVEAGEAFAPADMATASADGFRTAQVDIATLRGQRMVLCALLGECRPVIDALMQKPGDDDSDARLYGLISRIQAAQAAVAEEALEGCKA
jgi:hypothetical protein